MSEPTCQYDLLTGLTGQQDTDALNATLLRAVSQLLPQHSLRLYLKNTHSNGDEFGLIAGKADSQDRQWLNMLEKDVTSTTATDQTDNFPGWPLYINHRPIGAAFLEGEPLTGNQRLLFDNLIRIYCNQYNLLNSSTLDSLTSLYNRQAFEQMMNKVLSTCGAPKRRSVDTNEHCFFALLDIDHFKAINDKFGHLYGDEALLHFSQLMTRSFRDGDLLFRYGGEEFAIALFVEDADCAYKILERFRQRVEDYHFPQVDNVTVSIGYTSIKPNQLLTTLTDEADRALYYAKDHGRNQTHDYDDLVAKHKLEKTEVINDVELF